MVLALWSMKNNGWKIMEDNNNNGKIMEIRYWDCKPVIVDGNIQGTSTEILCLLFLY